MSHPWKSNGQKRTVVWGYQPDEEMVAYLRDMQDAIRYSLQIAYRAVIRDDKRRVPSPIQLRRELREWFYTRYNYARHHINPVCRAAVAILRSYRKNHHGELRIPDVKRLAMRIDGELFKLVTDGNSSLIRIALQPKHYAWIPVNRENRRYEEYSKGRPSELLITDTKVCLTFVVGEDKKALSNNLIATDLNFGTVDSTKATIEDGAVVRLVSVKTETIRRIAQIQNDFSRRRKMLQKHTGNPQKRAMKLTETRGRQRNRIKDALHKLSTETVRANPQASFIFENLKGIRKSGEKKGTRFRTYLNRWPYRMYHSFVDYKSQNKTLYASPRGTSSECPVCGGKLEHPTWAVSRCKTCGVDYDRNRLASLAILRRGLRLCGQPFAVSADASWQQIRDEYLYAPARPDSVRAGWTDAVSAPNGNAYEGIRS